MKLNKKLKFFFHILPKKLRPYYFDSLSSVFREKDIAMKKMDFLGAVGHNNIFSK